jgi:uncharacterized protein YneF (UPF0154 family)
MTKLDITNQMLKMLNEKTGKKKSIKKTKQNLS